ncbi:hypothetical protein IW261DRAFT_1426148 [Armillaria novae-zelandiae]|uniref:Uncharacterized protein n=1 Tax=Armillaria novae-zelandiae TaxID=153914 RepID=A0AA39NN77_9AGAR|nr:hypothetical protein IW261DRAFT_1426148 [Armillaria novae-zelandiae]
MPPLTTKSGPLQSATSRDTSATLSDGKKDDEAGIIGTENYSASVAEKRLLRRLDLRLIPAFVLMYTFSFFAVTNIGNIRILNAEVPNVVDMGDGIDAFRRKTFIVEGKVNSTSLTANGRHALLGDGLLTWFTGNLRDTNVTTLAIPIYVTFTMFGEMIGMFISKSVEALGYPNGHFKNGAVLFAGAICIGALKVIYKKRNRELAVGDCPDVR